MQTKAKSILALTAATLALPFGQLQAQSFSQAEQQAKIDLDKAIQDLSVARATIAKEKIPLIREVSKLEGEVRQQDAELNRLRRLRDNSESSLLRLNDRVKGLKAQNDYTASLLDEFVTAFESRINFSETQVYAEKAANARLAMKEPDIKQSERFIKQLDAIDSALDRMDALVGGYTFEGEAKSPDGEILEGSFAIYGPTVYFTSNDGTLNGLTMDKVNSAVPAIADLTETFTGINAFISSKEGTIPTDPTLGKALKIQESKDSIQEHLAKGGSVGMVILGLGAVCLALGLLKVIEITGFKTPQAERVQEIIKCIEDGNQSEALSKATSLPGAGGELLRKGVEFADEKRGTLEEILYEKILAVRPKLERFLPFMALTAAAAPLLGLLGTVTGMIKTFNLITVFGTGDAKSLSSGISEALVTTELGLVVAIPSLILHGMLSRMARQKLGDMEQTTVGFINGVVGARNKDTSNSEAV